jgi:hypothetical protein
MWGDMNKILLLHTLLILLLLFSTITAVEAADSSSTPTDTNSKQKGWGDKIIDWLINIFFKNFGESVYEDVKDSTEKVKEEGIFKEAKSDQDQKSEGAENQKEAYKVEIKALGEGELGYDDGEVDGYASSDSNGFAVFFSNDRKLNICGIKTCGARYDGATRKFDVDIWDKNLNTLYSASCNYTDFFPESYTPLEYSDLKWVTINVPNIEVNGNFYVAVFTYGGPFSWYKGTYELPTHKGGIVTGRDSDTESGNSFVVGKTPNRIVDWETITTWDLHQENTDWMIHVVTARP